MKFLNNYIIEKLLFAFLLYNSAVADHYKHNIEIDIQYYTFKITLSDSTAAITGKAEIEIKFLSDGTKSLIYNLQDLTLHQERVWL